MWRVLLDKEFKAKLKIVKKDDETKKSILSAGTEFKVYDLDNQKYVEQVTTYPVTTTHKSYFTDSQGANVKHFFTLLGKMFFTLYGKEFFTYPGKKIFTS